MTLADEKWVNVTTREGGGGADAADAVVPRGTLILTTDDEYAFEQHTLYNKSENFPLDIIADTEDFG